MIYIEYNVVYLHSALFLKCSRKCRSTAISIWYKNKPTYRSVKRVNSVLYSIFWFTEQLLWSFIKPQYKSSLRDILSKHYQMKMSTTRHRVMVVVFLIFNIVEMLTIRAVECPDRGNGSMWQDGCTANMNQVLDLVCSGSYYSIYLF